MKKFLYLVLILCTFSCVKKQKETFKYHRPNPQSLKYTDQPVIDKADKVEVTADLSNKGIGSIKEYIPEEINPEWVKEGEALFKSLCAACHKIEKKFIGPALKGLAERRSPEWALNMMLGPTEMLASDPIAQQLLLEANGAPMADQNLTEEQAKQLFDYIRSH